MHMDSYPRIQFSFESTIMHKSSGELLGVMNCPEHQFALIVTIRFKLPVSGQSSLRKWK